jgi:predicted transcriptional regulator of viral defense system
MQMKNETSLQIKQLKQHLDKLMSAGQYCFTTREASAAFALSRNAVKQGLHRLCHKGEVASPARGFYVIVPPEYRALGCLPADQFIPTLMQQAGKPYYVGLLSAAQYHGAAHHRPQEFQVMAENPRRAITCGKVRISFHVCKRLSTVPTQMVNTPRGTILVSTPEATAFDLVGYEAKIGGLDAVATVLMDLAAKLNTKTLGEIAPIMPLHWAQRLGWLLEHIGEAPKAKHLKIYIHRHAKNKIPLQSFSSTQNTSCNNDWKLFINADIETEL